MTVPRKPFLGFTALKRLFVIHIWFRESSLVERKTSFLIITLSIIYKGRLIRDDILSLVEFEKIFRDGD